jgi:hypothetical protein
MQNQPEPAITITNVDRGELETIEGKGEVPEPRFGHTIIKVSKEKVVLFGGACGDTGRFGMRGETYLMNVENMTWKKLQGKRRTMKFEFTFERVIIPLLM